MSLYYNPVFYGMSDVTIPDGSGGSFAARVYYPSEELGTWDVPIRDGSYPLIAFAHGDRSAERSLCPPDRTADYTRWGYVLHLMARCGFVVVSPAVQDVVHDPEQTAERLEDAIAWVRGSWTHRESVHKAPVVYLDPDRLEASSAKTAEYEPAGGDQALWLARGFGRPDIRLLGSPTALGVVGHSWGARAAARVAVRGRVKVAGIASIAGSWDDNASIRALIDAGLPTVMVAGTDDFLNASYLQGLWSSLPIPKHQALIEGIGHWDWFGPYGSIHPCDENAPVPACRSAGHACQELVLAFMTKYLYGHWWRPPYLLGSPGGRPPLMPYFDGDGPCALKVRWHDPTASQSLGEVGDRTLGPWTAPDPW